MEVQKYGISTAKILFLALILIVAAWLRFIALKDTVVFNPVRADAVEYLASAYNLKFNQTYSSSPSGLGHPGTDVQADALRSPGYPLFLALFLSSKLTENELKDALAVQTALSVVTVLLCYYLFHNFLPTGLALFATLLTALSPHLVIANVYLLTETFFAFSTVAWILLIVQAFKHRQSIPWLFFAGVALAYSVLVRPSAQYLLPVLATAFFFLWLPYARKQKLNAIAALIVGFVLLYGPWATRNLITLGKLGGDELMKSTLYHGCFPGFMYQDDPKTFGFPYRADPRAAEISRDLSSVFQEIRRRFIEEPEKHLRWYLLGKPVTLWQWNIIAGMGDVFVYPVTKSPYLEKEGVFFQTHKWMKSLHPLLLILAFTGIALSWIPGKGTMSNGQDRKAAQLISLVLLYFTALHMVGAPFPRYSVPLRPLMYGMAVFGGWNMWQRMRTCAKISKS